MKNFKDKQNLEKIDIAPHEEGNAKRNQLKSDLKFIAIFIVIFSLLRFFVYDYFIIPSSSMVPSLLIGDMPLVEKWRYGYSRHSIWFSPNIIEGRKCVMNDVKRGEVIVFKDPADQSTNVIKRVIALPGDTVSVNNGVITVNDVDATLNFKEKMIYHDTNQRTVEELTVYEEKLPHSETPVHTVAYYEPAKNSEANHFEKMTVPPGHFFVMGDNRDFSKDSRCGLGLIPSENLMGRAVRLVYSIGNGVRLWEFWLWLQNIRFPRIFQRII